jgi:hypothetical protein
MHAQNPPSTLCILLTTLLAVAGQGAFAQCATSTQNNTIQCNNPAKGCKDTVVQILPNFSEYGIRYTPGSVTCCSATYSSFVQLGGFGCNGSGKLADPTIRKHLIELAKSNDIMVSSCRGEYRPLVIALAEQPASNPAEQFDPARTRRTLAGTGRGGQ